MFRITFSVLIVIFGILTITSGRCLQQKEEGTGDDELARWFYNVKSRKCENFIYTGWGGNGNNFPSKDLCRTKCKVYIHPKITVNKQPHRCLQPKEEGNADDKFQRWFYDVNSRKCKKFIYTGCGGNGNNFPSKNLCRTKCYLTENPESDETRNPEPDQIVFGPPKSRNPEPDQIVFGPPKSRNPEPDQIVFGPPKSMYHEPDMNVFGPPKSRNPEPDEMTRNSESDQIMLPGDRSSNPESDEMTRNSESDQIMLPGDRSSNPKSDEMTRNSESDQIMLPGDRSSNPKSDEMTRNSESDQTMLPVDRISKSDEPINNKWDVSRNPGPDKTRNSESNEYPMYPKNPENPESDETPPSNEATTQSELWPPQSNKTRNSKPNKTKYPKLDWSRNSKSDETRNSQSDEARDAEWNDDNPRHCKREDPRNSKWNTPRNSKRNKGYSKVHGCADFEGKRLYIIADDGNRLGRCSKCGPSFYQHAAGVHGIPGYKWTIWTAISAGDKCAFKSDEGSYLARCKCCWRGALFTESVFVHGKSPHETDAQWTLEKYGDLYAFKAAHGKYMTRCTDCVPGGTKTNFAFLNSDRASGRSLWGLKFL